MSPRTQALLTIGAAIAIGITYFQIPPGKFFKPAMYFTGQVIDADTNQPIEGAYVIADYREVSRGWAGVADKCYRVRGMTTGKDGKFSFPIEALDSYNPSGVFAIKPDYYTQYRPDREGAIAVRSEATYTNRHVFLKKQDPAKPSNEHGFSDCERPASKEAVASAVMFLEMKLQERRKYFPQNSDDSIEYFIERMKNPEPKKWIRP
jgi:hypothetical protein